MGTPPRIIEDQCWIFDTVTKDKVVFQMMPEVSDSKSVNWNPIDIVGRSHPLLAYNSSGPRTFSFTLTFFAHASVRDDRSIEQISSELNWLMSLAYPDYGGGQVRPPHKCILKLGKQIVWPVVAQDISISYKSMWAKNLPVHAEVSCTFLESAMNAISYSQVRGGGGTVNG